METSLLYNQPEKVKGDQDFHSTESPTEDSFYYDFSERYRWKMLIVVILFTLFLGPVTLNWPPLRNIFGESGAFNYLCDNPENLININCVEKQTALENVGGRATSIYFSMLIVCGILLDLIGPKLCAFCGLFVTVLGWIIIGFSSPKFQGFAPGVYMISATMDAMFMGLLSMGNLFPGYATTILGILGSARSISFSIPLIMQSLFIKANFSLQTIAWSYAAIFTVVGLTAISSLPYQPFPKLTRNLISIQTPCFNKKSIKEYTCQAPDLSMNKLKIIVFQQFKDIFCYLLKPSYWIFVIVLCMNLTRNGYYIETSPTHLPNTETVYTIVSPLSFIPCPFLGYVVDRLAATLSLGIVCTCGMLSILILLIRSIPTQYISIMINWVFISFTGSECYCYIAFIYPQKVQGKLTGLSFLVAGLVSFSTNSMNIFAKSSSTHLLIMDLIVVIMESVGIALCVVLYLFLERPYRNKLYNCIKSDGQPINTTDIPKNKLQESEEP